MKKLYKLTCIGVNMPDHNRFTFYTSTYWVAHFWSQVIASYEYSVTIEEIKSFEGGDNEKATR